MPVDKDMVETVIGSEGKFVIVILVKIVCGLDTNLGRALSVAHRQH